MATALVWCRSVNSGNATNFCNVNTNGNANNNNAYNSLAVAPGFCKPKFTLTETGAVKTNGAKASMKRARHKLKAFRAKVDAGEMTLADVATFMQSQIAYFENYDDHGRILKLRRLHHALFVKPGNNQKEV